MYRDPRLVSIPLDSRERNSCNEWRTRQCLFVGFALLGFLTFFSSFWTWENFFIFVLNSAFILRVTAAVWPAIYAADIFLPLVDIGTTREEKEGKDLCLFVCLFSVFLSLSLCLSAVSLSLLSLIHI